MSSLASKFRKQKFAEQQRNYCQFNRTFCHNKSPMLKILFAELDNNIFFRWPFELLAAGVELVEGNGVAIVSGG